MTLAFPTLEGFLAGFKRQKLTLKYEIIFQRRRR